MGDKSPIWTALYSRHDKGCYWIKFGQRDGPPISRAIAIRLARKMLKKNKELLMSLDDVRPYYEEDDNQNPVKKSVD